jgi:hypothetical protein
MYQNFIIPYLYEAQHVSNGDIRKRELDIAEKGKEESLCFWAMDVEKNFTSSLDRVENEPFSFGIGKTQKITWSQFSY